MLMIKKLRTFCGFAVLSGTLASGALVAQPADQTTEEDIAENVANSEFEDTPFIHLFRFEPNYFLLGTPDTKVQLSFKLEPIKHSPIYIGFTQTLFWNLFSQSLPFEDINYNPSIFYRLRLNKTSYLEFIAIEHESNGQGDAESRSWNRSGLRYQTYQSLSQGRKNQWDLQVWIPIFPSKENKDLAEYRGIYNLRYTLTGILGPSYLMSEISFRMYPGGSWYIDPLKGGQELTFQMRGKSKWFLANIVAQIFHGYGENMLNYKKHTFGARIGFGI